MQFTSSSVAGIGTIWCEAWNILKWYKLEFWNQIADQDAHKCKQTKHIVVTQKNEEKIKDFEYFIPSKNTSCNDKIIYPNGNIKRKNKHQCCTCWPEEKLTFIKVRIKNLFHSLPAASQKRINVSNFHLQTEKKKKN